jgi:hypothetical protein
MELAMLRRLEAIAYTLALSSLCKPLLCQPTSTTNQPKTFHVSGTVLQSGTPVPNQWVTFDDGKGPVSVRTEFDGYYGIDLPLGVWTATVTLRQFGLSGNADPPDSSLSMPRRFRVTVPRTVSLDLFLHPPVGCAGIKIITSDGHPPTNEEIEQRDEDCRGERIYPIPSVDGVPFELRIGGLAHDLCQPRTKHNPACEREFATYNLLSVQADKLIYHQLEGVLEASGNVVIKDESGEHRKDSVAFGFADGRAIQLQ